MDKPRRSWTVTPHEGLVQHEENLWSVEGMVPGAPFRRRMCIARRSDGSLLFFHAVPLEDKVLEQVKALGKPAYLVVGHHQHAIDAHPFAERLGLKIFGPRRSEAALRRRCDFGGALEDVPADPAVSVQSLPGSKLAEAVIVVAGELPRDEGCRSPGPGQQRHEPGRERQQPEGRPTSRLQRAALEQLRKYVPQESAG